MTAVPLELYANKPRSPVHVNGEGPFDFGTGAIREDLGADEHWSSSEGAGASRRRSG